MAQKAKLKAMSTLQGVEFDRAYAQDIGVAAHEEAVSLFKNAQSQLTDAALKSYVKKTLPILEHHLEMAKEMKERVSG